MIKPRIKVFARPNAKDLEKAVNAWLKANDEKIIVKDVKFQLSFDRQPNFGMAYYTALIIYEL